VSHFEQPSHPRDLELRPDGSETHSSMAASMLAAIVTSIILIGAIAFLPSGLH